MPFAGTWMDLEIIIIKEVRQRQISYNITYKWNLKKDTNELIYKIERNSQALNNKFMVTRGNRWGGEIDWDFRNDMYTLLYLELSTRTYCIAHGTLLNVMCQPGWEENLGESGYMTCICMAESLCCPPETATRV